MNNEIIEIPENGEKNYQKLIYEESLKQTEILEKQLSEFMVNIVGRVIWNGSKEHI